MEEHQHIVQESYGDHRLRSKFKDCFLILVISIICIAIGLGGLYSGNFSGWNIGFLIAGIVFGYFAWRSMKGHYKNIGRGHKITFG